MLTPFLAMKEANQYYANGRVAVMSTKTFGADKFQRLIDCVTLQEAVKVLQENGIGQGVTLDNANDYDSLLTAELDHAMGELKELCIDVNTLKYFLCKYDYLNAKVLMKCKYMRIDGLNLCYYNASYNPQDMQQAILSDDYGMFSKRMAVACDKIDMEFAQGNRSAQLIDTVLDKAMYADMKHYATFSQMPTLRKVFAWQVDTTNIMLAVRFIKAGLTLEQLHEVFIDGGSVNKQSIDALWNDDVSLLTEDYRKFYSLIKRDNTFVTAEKEQKQHIRVLFSTNPDTLSVQPVIDYFLQKVSDVDKIRLVLVGIKGGTDKEKIKESIN